MLLVNHLQEFDIAYDSQEYINLIIVSKDVRTFQSKRDIYLDYNYH